MGNKPPQGTKYTPKQIAEYKAKYGDKLNEADRKKLNEIEAQSE
jgi:hypothetical protein